MKSSETILEPTIYERPIVAGPTVDPYMQPNMIQDYENVKQERHTYETIKSSAYENIKWLQFRNYAQLLVTFLAKQTIPEKTLVA